MNVHVMAFASWFSKKIRRSTFKLGPSRITRTVAKAHGSTQGPSKQHSAAKDYGRIESDYGSKSDIK